MQQHVGQEVSRLFRQQHGVASRAQLRSLGVTPAMVRLRVAREEWELVTPRVVRVAGSRMTPEQALAVALVEAGPRAVASHESAAWLWDLLVPPERPAVTVPPGAWNPHGPFRVHRPAVGATPVLRKGFLVTNPLRTLVDLAGVVGPDVIDAAVDAAVASKLVSVEAIWAEVGRLSRHGRRGVGAMRGSLDRRGLMEGPHPSVLEARLHRLLKAAGIAPLSVETSAGPDGSYRIDCLLDPVVAVEVDGHRYHSTPEQKRRDERRRAQLRMEGRLVLVYDWREITHDARRVVAECLRAMAVHARTGAVAAPRPTSGRMSRT
jgi:very-short-patch-repair endonuclease